MTLLGDLTNFSQKNNGLSFRSLLSAIRSTHAWLCLGDPAGVADGALELQESWSVLECSAETLSLRAHPSTRWMLHYLCSTSTPGGYALMAFGSFPIFRVGCLKLQSLKKGASMYPQPLHTPTKLCEAPLDCDGVHSAFWNGVPRPCLALSGLSMCSSKSHHHCLYRFLEASISHSGALTYASQDPMSWPFLRRSARAVTNKAIRGAAAIKKTFPTIKRAVRSLYGASVTLTGAPVPLTGLLHQKITGALFM